MRGRNNRGKRTPSLGAAPGPNRNRVRGRIGGDSTTVQVAFVGPDMVTDATGNGGLYAYVDAGRVVMAAGFSKSYQLYRIKSWTAQYVPKVGATATGTVTWNFIDNPEVISKVVVGVYGSADFANLTKTGPRNRVKNTSSWQAMSSGMPSSVGVRRKWYSIDTADLDATKYEALDRTCQAMQICTYSGPPSSTIGYCVYNITIEYKDYIYPSLTPPTLKAVAPRQWQDADGRWWEEDGIGGHVIPAPSMTTTGNQ